MLLLHQIGSVKIGEIVRYSVTYTPAFDRILPAPEYLYLKVRNTSNSALRAAFVHGPYTLYVDAYPAHFDPNEKFAHPRKYGVPEFEPMLKAGGTWTCRLLVPEHVRHEAGTGSYSGEDDAPPSVSWIINVSSQVIFSTSAAVHFEVLLARDPKALESGGGITAGIPVLLGGDSGGGSGKSGSHGQGQVLQPGKVSDYQRGRDGRHPDQPRGVFSRAIRMRLEDTTALWNKPELPGWSKPPSSMRIRTDEDGVTVEAVAGGAFTKKQQRHQKQQQDNQEEQQRERQKTLEQSNASKSQAKQQARETIPAPKPGQKKKKVHLVILTHGLHSNLGGDMLYIKESIDVAVQQAKIDRKARKEKERAAKAEARRKSGALDNETETNNGEKEEEDDDEDEEDVIVRGYPGNATRTERGIKYLGKRLARYILSMTYPDQPYLPSSKKVSEKTAVALHGGNQNDVAGERGHPAHKHSTIQNAPAESLREYQFTKISFIAHSLGGPVQTYAVAYIQKHSPQFFDLIEPINFIGMASPFLGLNHENPLYVKFALDFGLVGRTGQDLGLTWRAPTIARSGWSSLVGNLSDNAHKKVLGEAQPESKPLLRILPTGPAHTALKKFRNRTVYSNVVNDGIVPLRTSCLLFLDWQGLDRVEKARREAGLVETVVGFGWAELIGNNATTPRAEKWEPKEYVDEDDEDEGEGDEKKTDPAAATRAGGDNSSGTETLNAEGHNQHEVPQPSTDATREDDRQSLRAVAMSSSFDHDERPQVASPPLPSPDPGKLTTAATNNANPFSNFFSNLFKNNGSGNEDPTHSPSGTTPRSGSVASGGSSSNPKSPAQNQHPHPNKSSSHTSSMSSKQSKIYQRSQTLRPGDWGPTTPGSATSNKSRVTTGQELGDDAGSGGMTGGGMSAPPRTSFFESATDIINPKLPSVEFLIDPSKRPRAIFHDRIYHPSDIPAPPLKRRATGNLARRRLSFQQRSKTSLSSASGGNGANNSASNGKSRSSSPYQERSAPSASAGGSGGVPHMDSGLSAQDYDDMANTNPDRDPDEVIDTSSIKVEEKIARAYHRGLSWRKVLVKLEPDAHNNMVVRRMFANAFGWPVVKHMVDGHFSDSAAARMRDEDEDNAERALPLHEAPDEHGAETRTQKQEHESAQTDGAGDDAHDDSRDEDDSHDAREAEDQATDLPETPLGGHVGLASRPKSKSSTSLRDGQQDNVAWSDRDWNDSGDESDSPGGSTGATDEDHLAYGASKEQREPKEQKEQRQPAKSPLSSSTTGVSVTATGGTTTGPQSPLDSPLSSPPKDSLLAEASSAAPKVTDDGNSNDVD